MGPVLWAGGELELPKFLPFRGGLGDGQRRAVLFSPFPAPVFLLEYFGSLSPEPKLLAVFREKQGENVAC